MNPLSLDPLIPRAQMIRLTLISDYLKRESASPAPRHTTRNRFQFSSIFFNKSSFPAEIQVEGALDRLALLSSRSFWLPAKHESHCRSHAGLADERSARPRIGAACRTRKPCYIGRHGPWSMGARSVRRKILGQNSGFLWHQEGPGLGPVSPRRFPNDQQGGRAEI